MQTLDTTSGAGDTGKAGGDKINANFAEILASVSPFYVAGRFYAPFPASWGTAMTPGSGTVWLIPWTPTKTVTVSTLLARVGTAFAGGNFVLAAYASDATTGKPTGSPLASTAAGSTASASTAVSVAINNPSAISSYQFIGGTTYWLAIQLDNATATIMGCASTFSFGAFRQGAATAAAVFGTNCANGYFVTGSAYGTWPSMTAASFSDATGGAPGIGFTPSSVP